MNSGEIVARLEIEQAQRLYSLGLDQRRFELWKQVFTADAVIDFTPMGGRRETPGQMAARLDRPDADRYFAEHPVTNTTVEFDGETARAHSLYTMETGRRGAEPGTIKRVSGAGWYEDTLRRTEEGWRICERRVFQTWKHSRTVPDEVVRPGA